MRSVPKAPAALAAVLAALAYNVVAASAHHITGTIEVNCHADPATVRVTVTAWSGNVEIKNLSTRHLTERAPSKSDATVVFTVKEIGGNGHYTAGREGHPDDPTPVAFTVDCVTPRPTPSPTPSPTPTPTHTPTPTPSPTDGQSPGSTPSPTSAAGGNGGVLAAATTVPGLPDAGGGSVQSGDGYLPIGALVFVAGAIVTALRLRRRPM